MTIGSATNPTGEYYAVPVDADGHEVGKYGPNWKPVVWPGIEGYEISDSGTVKRTQGGRLLKLRYVSEHLWVSLRDTTGFVISIRVDRLVLSTFICYEDRLMPEHRDGISRNCRLDNLEWREPTPQEEALAQGAASRKARAKVARATKADNKVPPAPQREVTMTRTYELDGMAVKVTPEGGIPKDGLLPKLPWSPEQVISMAAIFAKIADFNILIGSVR